MTCKPSGPTGRTEMEKGLVGSHKSDGEGSTSTSDMQAIGSYRLNGDQKGPIGTVTLKPSGPTDWMEMEKGAVGSHGLDRDGQRCH